MGVPGDSHRIALTAQQTVGGKDLQVHAFGTQTHMVHGVADEDLGQAALLLGIFGKALLLQACGQFVGLVGFFQMRADDAEFFFNRISDAGRRAGGLDVGHGVSCGGDGVKGARVQPHGTRVHCTLSEGVWPATSSHSSLFWCSVPWPSVMRMSCAV